MQALTFLVVILLLGLGGPARADDEIHCKFGNYDRDGQIAACSRQARLEKGQLDQALQRTPPFACAREGGTRQTG